MRFKLDEHFDARLAALVAEGGHDVETLVREGLGGADDDAVYDACRREERTLVTLDPQIFFRRHREDRRRPPPGNVLPMIRLTLASAWPDLKSRSLNFRALSMAGLRLPSCLDRCRLGVHAVKWVDLANTEVATPLGKIDPEPIVGLAERLSSGADGIGGIVTDAGGLIQTAVGKAGGFGSRRTNRSGCAVYAAANTAARWMHTVSV